MKFGEIVKAKCTICAKRRLCRIDNDRRYSLYVGTVTLRPYCLMECSRFTGGPDDQYIPLKSERA